MTIFKQLKPLLALVLLTTVVGCKLQVISPAGGYITWVDNGEDKQCQTGSVCQIDVSSAPFTKSFTAVHNPGYQFERWSDGGGFSFQCANSTARTCTVTINDDAAGKAIVAVLSSGYIMPIFTGLGVDTDGDGVRDELDDDDDNDGILDVNDDFPLDPSETSDTDGDTVGDNADQCADTPAEATVGADGCAVVDPGRVFVIREAIPTSAMASTVSYDRSFAIPGQGTVLAQSFTMPGDAGDADGDGVGRDITSYGKFVFHTVPGAGFTPAIDIWVSDAPGGEPISSQCILENGLKASELRYAAPIEVGLNWWCGLKPSQSYYLNVVHVDSQDPSSRIERLVKVTRVQNDDECPGTPAETAVDANGCAL